MSPIHGVLHVNECSVCEVPPPGNLVTGPAATRLLDPRLFALSGCQLPSMPCSNYCLWINCVLLLARCAPRLVFLADQHTQIQCRRQTGLYVSTLKSRHPGRSSPADQTHNRPHIQASDESPVLFFLFCFFW